MKKILALFLVCIVSGFILISCEPDGWGIVGSLPKPVEDLSITHNSGSDHGITAEFTIKTDNVTVLFYYSTLSAPNTEIFVISNNSDQTVGFVSMDQPFDSAELSFGTDYNIIVHLVDSLGRQSEGVSQQLLW